MGNKLISVVIPCYNEQSVIPETHSRLTNIFQSSGHDYELIFVNDGSNDQTESILEALHGKDSKTHYISFSRNFGHQAALKAGIDNARGDAVITMDADLQHPPELIPQFIAKWQEGYDIVYTQRQSSDSNSFFKNLTSAFFYKLMNRLSTVTFENGIADFRLLDKKVINIIRQTHESNLFLRGYISWAGFKAYKIVYTPNKRFAGTTKYSNKKMMALALNGITSFSTKPLSISIYLGMLISVFAFLYAVYAVMMFLFTDRVVTGWTSILMSVLFLGGIQLLMIGIVGQYLGKLFMQAKGRPDYIIQNKTL